MTVYRLTRKAHADLTGSGGLHAAGRCNRKGTPVIYAAQHVSLALVEALVHLDLADIPSDCVLVTIDIPGTVPIRRATPEEALAASAQPPAPVFIVPSVIVPQEFNIVIYPQAVGFSARITNVEPFRVDERLLGLGKYR